MMDPNRAAKVRLELQGEADHYRRLAAKCRATDGAYLLSRANEIERRIASMTTTHTGEKG